jgi:hypothetical protein
MMASGGSRWVEQRDLIHHGVRTGERMEKDSILQENIAKLRRFSQEPRFPKAREVWDGVRLGTSHTHTDPAIPSLFLNANHLTYEMAKGAGIRLDEVLSAVYDNAIPKDDFGIGHRIQLGKSGDLRPAFLKGDIAYSLQPAKALTVNIKALGDALSVVFGHDEDQLSRVKDVLNVIDNYQKKVQTGWRDVSSALSEILGTKGEERILRFISVPDMEYGLEAYALAMRARELVPRAVAEFRKETEMLLASAPGYSVEIVNGGWEIMGKGLEKPVGFVNEVNFSSTMGKVADTLEILGKEYGKPFYEMPLSGSEFEAVGYVKAIASDGRRIKVSYNGETFDFSYTYKDFNGDEKNVNRRIPREESYEAIRNGELIPTVPVIILAVCTGPQIQHLGNIAWKKYSGKEIRRQVEWLGIAGEESSASVAEELTLTTHGHEVVGVRFGDGDDDTLHGLQIGYIAFGPEKILKNLSEGAYSEVEIKALARK